ncbi:TraR/DksA family transcriptional regulator [Ramlibacter sp. AN1015]|uniref:TraR/DksA family transcriptional regulator n=1 Tax=Ramlibacter sp. AN1015 TaxID=3133428 RepID=UPI0030BFBE09
MELTEQQRAELDLQLAEREDELAHAVRDNRHEFTDGAGHGWPEVKDSVEDGDARMMESLDITQLRRHEAALSEVREARQRLRDGSYGSCEECGEDIGYARLHVVPAARYCLRHEAERERQGQMPAG